MSIFHSIFVILLIAFLSSCTAQEKTPGDLTNAKAEALVPDLDLSELESSFMNWWKYYSYTTPLSANFIGLDEQSDTIGKGEFLERLRSGDYVPLKIKSKDDSKTYQLFKLSPNADQGIGVAIRNESRARLKQFNMEGTAFPAFDFVDLNGNRYNNANTKGKTIVLKTWFIGCAACVVEFPELNELVEHYEKREDIIFMSLALDDQQALKNFLEKKSFAYQVVANQKIFIGETLNLRNYPTHLIIDKNGIIRRVVNKASEMIEFLEKEVS